MKTTWIAALLLLPLAGCTQPAPDATTAAGPEPVTGASSQEAAAAPPPAQGVQVDAGTALELRTRATAEGGLASFLYTIPKGVVFQEESSPDFTSDYLSFQVAPVASEAVGKGLDQYGLLIFELAGGVADLRGSYTSSAREAAFGLGPLAPKESIPPRLEPGLMTVWADGLGEGDQLLFVLGARGGVEGDFALAVRSLGHFPDWERDVPSSAAGLGPRVALPPQATGSGLQLAQYYHYVSFLAYTGEAANPYVKVADLLPRSDAGATVRDVTFNAPGFDSGYTYNVGVYYGYEAHGLWSASGSLHGVAVEHQSPIAMDMAAWEAWNAETLLLGLPLYVYSAEGTGASDVAFHVQVGNANLWQFLAYYKLDLGTTLQELAGVPALSGGSAFTGLAGNVPPAAPPAAWLHGGHVRLFDGRALHTFDLPVAAPGLP